MSDTPEPLPLLTPAILHDLPLQNEKTDFHFDEFAITLARLIASKNTRTPLTIGVSGSWGSGKTTLLRRTQMFLDQTGILRDLQQPVTREKVHFLNDSENPQTLYRSCRTVWFNAWKYSDEDTLLVALVRKIVQTMTEDGVVNEVLGKMLDPAYHAGMLLRPCYPGFRLKSETRKLG